MYALFAWRRGRERAQLDRGVCLNHPHVLPSVITHVILNESFCVILNEAQRSEESQHRPLDSSPRSE